jgi:dihydropteroate synthase
VPVSIDTTKAGGPRRRAAGAVLVNDVSAGALDDDMLPTVAELDCGYVLMHMQGTPQTMQDDPTYTDVVAEVYEFLAVG